MVREQVIIAKASITNSKKPSGQKTVFYDLLTSDQLSPEDKSIDRLEAEGITVFAAG